MSSAPSAPLPATPPAAVVAVPAASAPGPDPHSFARPAEARVRHVGLDLDVDFTARTLSGTATLAIERAASGDTLVLDTRDLEIEAVEAATTSLTTPPRLATAALAWTTTTWQLGSLHPVVR
jgi:aminopeptidase N